MQFNSGLFWECHETLEDVWLNTPYPIRLFYHALIKIAAGFYHITRHNRQGARAKLSDGVRLLPLFPPTFFGVRADLLCQDACVWLYRLSGSDLVSWRELEALDTPQVLVMQY